MRHCLRSIVNPERREHKEMFNREGRSMKLYQSILSGGSNTIFQNIDWDKVQEVQTEAVHRTRGRFRGVHSYIKVAKETLWSSRYPYHKERSEPNR